MKAKKNIIKKISQFNSFKLKHRKELKHWIRTKNFKNKNFNILLNSVKYLGPLYKINKYCKHNIVKTSIFFNINNNIYFNYITNGLNLKYDDQLVQFSDKNNFIINFKLKKTVYTKNNSLNVNSLQKLCTIYDNKYVNSNKFLFDFYDIFNVNTLIFSSLINEIYSVLIKNLLLKLINNISKKL